MRLTIDRSKLAGAVEQVARAARSNSPLPVLKCVLMEAREGAGGGLGFALTATDLNLGMHLEVEAEVFIGGEGSAAVPGALLVETVKRLPRGEVRIEVDEAGKVHFRAGRSHLHLASLPGDEFPQIPNLKDEGWTLPQGVLRKLLRRVLIASAKDDVARPVMTGVLTIAEPDGLVMCATDGRRLAWARHSLPEDPGRSCSMVVPRSAYIEVERLLSDTEDPVTVAGAGLGPDSSFIAFRLPCLQVTCRLLEGHFPDFTRVIPKTFWRTFVCNRQDLADAVQRMLLVATEKDSPGLVVFDFREGNVRLRAFTPDVGDGEDQVSGTLEGDPLQVAFNGHYLLDAVGALDTEQVEIRLQDEKSAGIVRPPGDTDSVHVIMPVRLREGFPAAGEDVATGVGAGVGAA